MFEIPTSITIGDTEYGIRNKGDFRMVLDCFSALQDVELTQEDRIVASVVIFYDTFSLDNVFDILDTQDKFNEAVNKMYDFFNCGQKNLGNKTPYKLVDWEQDEQLIASAINNVANTEIRFADYIHWWTFMGYYMAIGESTLSTVVSIRSKIMEGKKLEKYEQEFRRKNPEYFVWNRQTVEQQELDAWAHEIWNSQ